MKIWFLDSDHMHCGAGPGVHVQDFTQRPGGSALSAEESSWAYNRVDRDTESEGANQHGISWAICAANHQTWKSNI